MTEITTETVTTQESASSPTNPIVAKQVKVEATNYQTLEYFIYFMFGVLEVLLAFRLVLKLTGASIMSSFVDMVYGVSGLFILPFEGIFHRAISQGIETASVLEPATLVAIVVYAVAAWGIIQLLRIVSREKQSSN
ncbi:MAG TPA: hypothetical protein VLI92_02640 [Candidatus Saccharimonadales bacterium]|nr:hypothetical protein [Candidatus Saccharimonadales bacterium]